MMSEFKHGFRALGGALLDCERPLCPRLPAPNPPGRTAFTQAKSFAASIAEYVKMMSAPARRKQSKVSSSA